MWNEILQQLARKSARDGTLPEPTPQMLADVWPALVGTQIAQMSTPIRLEGRTLYVAARHQNLVDDWKHSPLPLLRRLRRFSPWSIETLDIEYDPQAGVVESSSNAPTASEPSVASHSAQLPADAQEEAIDSELRTLIEKINEHRIAKNTADSQQD